MRLTKHQLMYIVLLTPLLCPSTLVHYSMFFQIIKLLKLTSLGYAAMLVLAKKVEINTVTRMMCLLWGWQLLSTILTTGRIGDWFSNTYPYVAIVILSQYYLRRYGDEFVNSIVWIYAIFLLINYFTWINGGLYIDTTSSYNTERRVYFLGIRNSVGYFSAAAFPLMVAMWEKKWKWIIPSLSMILTVIFIFKESVSAAIMTLLIFAIGSIFLNSDYRKSPFRYKLIIAIAVALIVGIVFFRIQNLFSVLLVDVLGESINFNGRTIIWDSLLSQIKGAEWLIGHGCGYEKRFIINGLYTNFAHNQFLGVIFDYGVIGMALFVFIHIKLFKSFFITGKSKNKLLFMGIIAILCGGLVEALCDTVYYYLLITVTYYLNVCEERGEMNG